MELDIRIEELPNALRVMLIGEAGMYEADALHLALTRLLATRPKLTIIDLSECRMLASVTMGALLSYKGGLKVQGGTMKVVARAGNVRNSLKHARLDQVMDLYDSVEAALK